MASYKLLLLPGDGIGPEVMAEVRRLVEWLNARGPSRFETEQDLVGGAALDVHGVPIAEDTMARAMAADAIIFGSVGGPKWASVPYERRPEAGLLRLRKELGLFANLRPAKVFDALVDASSLKRELVQGLDVLIVRELTGGIYFGERGRRDGAAFDTLVYTEDEIDRICEVAFRSARRKVTSVDKANVLETSRLWRETVTRFAADPARGRPDEIELDHLLVDNAAMQLVAAPRHFEVILTENLFGDILSDEAAMLTGSLGMLPSASLGQQGTPGVFEPVHGSAPDIAGTGAANPLAMFGSVALMLRHGLAMESEAAALESAVDQALGAGLRTRDLGGDATTEDATRAVLANL